MVIVFPLLNAGFWVYVFLVLLDSRGVIREGITIKARTKFFPVRLSVPSLAIWREKDSVGRLQQLACNYGCYWPFISHNECKSIVISYKQGTGSF